VGCVISLVFALACTAYLIVPYRDSFYSKNAFGYKYQSGNFKLQRFYKIKYFLSWVQKNTNPTMNSTPAAQLIKERLDLVLTKANEQMIQTTKDEHPVWNALTLVFPILLGGFIPFFMSYELLYFINGDGPPSNPRVSTWYLPVFFVIFAVPQAYHYIIKRHYIKLLKYNGEPEYPRFYTRPFSHLINPLTTKGFTVIWIIQVSFLITGLVLKYHYPRGLTGGWLDFLFFYYLVSLFNIVLTIGYLLVLLRNSVLFEKSIRV
jgi:hypothetical protein